MVEEVIQPRLDDQVCMGSGCVFTEAMFSLLSPTAQRSAQELPLVDKQSMETCPASGGETMLLEGHNFQLDSKVVFVEKAQGKKGGAVE